MTTQVATSGEAGGATAPPVDPDAARYAELAAELEKEERGGAESAEPASTEPAAEPAEPAEPVEKPKPTELENLQAALREEREARRAEQARTDAIVQVFRDAKERRGQQQDKPGKKPAVPQIPDVQADPIGHFQAEIAQLKAALAQAHQGGQQQHQQVTAHLQEQAMWATVQQAEANIRDPKDPDHKPDYDDAAQHLVTTRVRQLDRMYPSDAPQVIAAAQQAGFRTPAEYKQALLQQDGRGLIMQALQMGISPAVLTYNLALDAGYQPKLNGKAAQPGLADRAQQQIAAAKKGTKAALTLSGGDGGRKGPNDMSISDLANLAIEDPEAFDKAWDQLARAGKL